MALLSGETCSVSFYAEVYPRAGAKSTFIKWYIADNKGTLQPKLGQMVRESDKVAIPLLRTVNLDDLPTGQYELVIDVLDNQGQATQTERLSFYRENPLKQQSEQTLNELVIPLAFESALPPDEYLDDVIAAHQPISTLPDERLAQTVMASSDNNLKKRFLYAFWSERQPGDPVGAFKDYEEKVKYVQDKFGTRILKGYKADRGRVYLMYGPPNLVESRPSEPSSWPYEIWQYDQLLSERYPNQTNKQFIFGLFELASKNYRLIHSNAMGEMFNPNWGLQLANRTGSQIDMSEQTYDSDYTNEGSRARSNLIINGGSVDRVNRR